MKKRKFHLAGLIFLSLYFVARLFMKISTADRNVAFIYNQKDLELVLIYTDAVFTFLFFISLYSCFKENLAMKYITIALSIVFVPLSLFSLFMYNAFLDEGNKHFIGYDDSNEEYLVIIEPLQGLHPEIGDPREVYLLQKKYPLVYKKIGQSNLTIEESVLTEQPKVKFDGENPIVQLGTEEIYFE